MVKKKELKPCKKCHVTPKVTGNTIKCPKCGLKITVKPDSKRTVQEIWNNINTVTRGEIVWFGDKDACKVVDEIVSRSREVSLHDMFGIDRMSSVDGYSFRNSDEL